MKKILLAICIALGMITMMATTAEARGCGPCGPGWGRGPGGCRPCGPGWGGGWCRPGPPPCGPGWGGGWGRGGCNFWPGFIGGVVGGMVGNAISTPYYGGGIVAAPAVGYAAPAIASPVVYTQPAVVAQTAYTAGYSSVAPVAVTQPVTYSSNTTIVNPTPVQRAPLVGASVNVLGVGASVGVGY